jgi:4-hydroxy-2-oxoheptanedioate aldolase
MRFRTNRVKQALERGEPALGVAIQMNSPEAVEAAGASGFDFVYIDCEHGSFYIEPMTHMLRAAEAVGVTGIVRVPSHDPNFIMHVLDAGAMGVIVPNVSTADEARSAIAAAKYRLGDNGGRRGACPGTRATWHQTTDWVEFVQWSNENTMVWLLIETAEGVSNFDAISAVPGAHAAMLGPFDLAHDIGLPGQPRHPTIHEKYRAVMQTARDNGLEVVASLFSADPAEMALEKEKWIEAGARILVAGGDRRMLRRAMDDRLQALRTPSASVSKPNLAAAGLCGAGRATARDDPHI